MRRTTPNSVLTAQARLLDSVPGDGDSLETLERIEFEFDTLLLADDANVTITKLDGTSVVDALARR